MIQVIKITDAPCPNSPGIEGCGECAEYMNKPYHYPIAGKHIPKNKVVYLKWEGNYCGRRQGEKEYIVVCYNDKGELLFLETVLYGSIKKHMEKYKGLTVIESIALIEAEEQKLKKIRENFNKCSKCGESVIHLGEDQAADICYTCHNKEKPSNKK